MENRCLIPTSYYFEWIKVKTQKVKHAFRLLDIGGSLPRDRELPLFTILTRDAPHVAYIHDRMTVIISSHNIADWFQSELDALRYALDHVIVSPA